MMTPQELKETFSSIFTFSSIEENLSISTALDRGTLMAEVNSPHCWFGVIDVSDRDCFSSFSEDAEFAVFRKFNDEEEEVAILTIADLQTVAGIGELPLLNDGESWSEAELMKAIDFKLILRRASEFG